MRRARLTRAFAWLVIRLRWPIVLGWIAAAVAVIVYLPSLEEAGSNTSLVGLVPKDAKSIEAGVRSAELFDVPVITHTVVVQRDPDGLSRAALSRAADRARRVTDHRDPALREIEGALPIVNARGLVPSSRENGTTAITYLFFDPNRTDVDDQDELTRRYADQARLPGDALVGVSGAVPARMEEWNEIAEGLPWVTAATIAVIALILGVYFRSPVAPVIALTAAGAAYLVASRTVGVVGRELDVSVPRDAEPVLVVLLLGVITDYTVFFLDGLRERLREGEDRLDAAFHATVEYLPIVLTAGLIVAGGTLALVAGQLDFFRAFGPGMALTVLISLAVAVTFVPATMAILGGRAFWPSRTREVVVSPRPGRLALVAARRPVALAIALAALVVLAFGARGLAETKLGISQIRGLPSDAEPRRAAEAAQRGFAPGILAPTVVLLDGVDRARDLPGLVRLGRLLERQPGIATAVGPATPLARQVPGLVTGKEGSVRYLLVLGREPQASPAIEAVGALRERMPALLEEAGLEDVDVALAGDTPLAEETVDTITHDLLRIGIAAFLVNVLLLALFLRAIVAPIYLVLASAAALAASLGLTTLVFQGLLGHDDLTYHVPFAVAVLLLSLGSDYNVFVVGRIWQAAETMPLREAIATAAPRASRAITVAGLALALSFACLALIDLRQFREFAFAMVVGVLLDAFVVRSLLIPALISLFGESSWWPGRRQLPAEPEPVRT